MTMPWVERAALRLVPTRDRDALLGDLAEEGARGAWRRAATVAGVGAAYQREPYRDDRARVGIILLLAAGLALLRLVPLAASGLDVSPADGPVWRAAAATWAHAGTIAAVAAGLVVGRAPLVPEHAACARWHVAAALAIAAAATAGGWASGLASAALLLVATGFAAHGRHEEPPASTTA